MVEKLACYRFGTIVLIFLHSTSLFLKISPAGYLIIYRDVQEQYLNVIRRNKKFNLIPIYALLTLPSEINKIVKFLIQEYVTNIQKVHHYLFTLLQKSNIVDSDQFLEDYFKI